MPYLKIYTYTTCLPLFLNYHLNFHLPKSHLFRCFQIRDLSHTYVRLLYILHHLRICFTPNSLFIHLCMPQSNLNLFRVYWTEVRLSKIKPELDPICDKCRQAPATLMHISGSAPRCRPTSPLVTLLACTLRMFFFLNTRRVP